MYRFAVGVQGGGDVQVSQVGPEPGGQDQRIDPLAVAAAELGCDLDRIALVPDPGPDWPEVVAALLDGCDLVVAYPPASVTPALVQRLSARARQRGSVLVPLGRSGRVRS